MIRLPGCLYLEARDQAGLTPEQVCQLLAITSRTERTYRTQGCPVVVVRWLRLMAGDMEQISPAWKGWQLKQGELFSDQLHHNQRFRPGHLLAIWWDKQTIRSLKSDKRKLQAQIDYLEHEQENNVIPFPG